MRPKGRTAQERFEANVHPEPNSGCHLWAGTTTGVLLNYGVAYVRCRGGRGKQVRVRTVAHRRAWELYRGAVPEGMFVLHRCDTPLCVNPDHLFLGTHRDNMDDMKRKGRGRGRSGEAHNMAKLDWPAVRAIRRRRRAGETLASLATSFGVCESTVSLVARGEIWKEQT